MPRFTTSLLFGILVILGLLSASSRGTSTPAAHSLATAACQNQGPILDRRAIFRPRPRPDTPDPSFPDLGPGSRPGGVYPGDLPRNPDKKTENDLEVPEPPGPDGNAATTPAAAATQPSVAQCTSACNLNTAASGTASPETPSRASQTQGPALSESAGQSARLSQAAAGMALPLLLLLLLHLLA